MHFYPLLLGIFSLSVFPIQGFASTCTGPIIVNTQVELNALATLGETIDGDLTIQGSVTDLSPLNGIKVITGELRFLNTTSLPSISVFKLLTTDGGSIDIFNNVTLTSNPVFKLLANAGDFFLIFVNDALT